MNMPGMKMSGTHRMKHRRRRSLARSTMKPGMQNMPGMNMPQTSPSPSASPKKMEMNMPGMQMPTASPNRQASPQQKMEMDMPMPAASPGASPQKMEMNMPMPSASPSASPMAPMPGMEMGGTKMNM